MRGIHSAVEALISGSCWKILEILSCMRSLRFVYFNLSYVFFEGLF